MEYYSIHATMDATKLAFAIAVTSVMVAAAIAPTELKLI